MNFGKLSKLNIIIRLTVIVLIMVVLTFLCVARLMKIQIVDGTYNTDLAQKNYTAKQSVLAARGQIFDCNSIALNTNKIVYKVIIQKAFFTYGKENEIIELALRILKDNKEKWIDTVPITFEEPFTFTDVSDNELDKFKDNIGLNPDATVENCLKAMRENYKISDKYDEIIMRAIAGVRYQMQVRDFSYNNRYTMCEDVSLDTVIELKEQNNNLAGIDIIEEPIRVYLDSSSAAHTRGTIGAISAEQYTELKEQGYGYNDTIGKSGIELAMESVLRGENGERTIVRNSKGQAIADEITKSVKTGNSVKLTIDSRFQNDVQDILENHIYWLRNLDKVYNNPKYNSRGLDTSSGAVVVLEVKTGKVLALANYPTYDLNEYIDNYSAVLNAENNPILNRATTGLYRPGSTFKTITATSGLFNEIISEHDRVSCGGTYRFYTGYQPVCTGSHGAIDVVNALKWSCNIFFYDVGRRLGIETLASTAAHFGIGTDLGLETGGAKGRMTDTLLYESLTGKTFTGGDTLQASIGQSETLVTPLHLAVQAMTFANNGIRYQPYLVDSVWNYDLTELIYETEPLIVDSFATDKPEIYEIVRQGMIAVTDNVVWPPDNMQLSHFDFLPSKAAIKTGSPEVGDGTYNSTIVGYYPADNPEIAFGIFLENSEFSRYMVRNIIDAYFYDAYEPDFNEEGYIVTPWKRWSKEKAEKLLQ